MNQPVNQLVAYCDPGPLAQLLCRAGSRLRSPGTAVMLMVAVTPLAGVLLVLGRLPHPALVAAVGWYVVLTGLALGRGVSGRFGWLVPVLVRAAEYALVARATAVVAPEALPAAYGLIAAAAWHHYDAVYRLRHLGAAPPGWLAVAGGGFDLRMLVVALLALGGEAVLQPGLVVAAGALGAVFLVESVVNGSLQWKGQDVPIVFPEEPAEEEV